jgi:hypothetical protein
LNICRFETAGQVGLSIAAKRAVGQGFAGGLQAP